MKTIAEMINESIATVRQLSILSGVSEDKMYNWKAGKSEPRAGDIKSLEAVFAEIAEMSRDDIKKLVDKMKGTDQISLSTPKEVIALGKHVPLRLRPGEYQEAFGNWKGLPMYNTPVTASFIATYRDEKTFIPQYYLHDPRFRDCDFGAIITGDSMHSEIRHGDFIACKEIQDKRFIVFGDIYYVVATNGLETCKYINRDPADKDNLLLVPRNEAISPSPIPKDMISKLYKVRGIVRGY
jgi:hypothetical protein